MTELMYEIVEDVEASRPKWLRARRGGISASDTPNIMIPSEAFSSPCKVYASKVLDYTVPSTAAMEIGHILEPVVAEKILEDDRDSKFGYVGSLLRSKEYPWLLATPDYWVKKKGESGLYIYEIKTTHERNSNNWSDGVPAIYQLQVQQQLLVTGCEKAIVVVGFVKSEAYDFYNKHDTLDGFEEPLCGHEYFLIEKDAAVQKEIVEQTRAFWHDHVLARVPPEPLSADDILAAYPVTEGKEIELSHEKMDLIEERQEIDEILKDVKVRRNIIDDELKFLMKDAEKIVFDDKEVVIWKQSSRESFDAAAFKRDCPEQYENYAGLKKIRSFKVKRRR